MARKYIGLSGYINRGNGLCDFVNAVLAIYEQLVDFLA